MALLRGVVVLILASAAASPQLLTSFEPDDPAEVVRVSGATAERVQEHAADHEWALRVQFAGKEEDTWPGLSLALDPPVTDKQALQFQVHNPSAEAVYLSWRIDVEGREGGVFGGVTLPPKQTRAVDIWLAGLGAVKRVFPYIRMPRQDYALFFDDFRWFSLQDYFTALHYVDDPEPLTPTDEERERGYILFSRAFSDVVFANSVPRPEERSSTVDVFATPGEYEPASIALYALEDLTGVRVSFSGIPAQGEVLPVRCLDKRVVYSSREYVAGMPVLCERREAVDTPQGQSKQFVLDLRIEEDAAPGVYEGVIRIEREGTESLTLPLRLRVLPFRLTDPEGMFWGEYYTGPKFTTTEEEWSAQLRRDMTDMREHQMTSVGLCFGPSIENVVFAEGGACELNLEGTSHYEQFMELYVELGYPAPVILLSDTGQGAASTDAVAYESDDWASRYKAFWAAMQAEHERRGWPEVIVQPVDEPGWQAQERKDRNVRCLKLLKEIPGLRTEQDGPGDGYFHNVAGPFADVWNYNGSFSEPQFREALADGRTVVIYNCDVESYRPEADRYTAGWFQVASQTQGCYNWAYISFNGSPYDDQDHKTGTWMHVYPPVGDEPGGPSKGWIGAREGVDDYRYVHALRSAIARAQGSANAGARRAARQATEELQAIVESLDYSPRVRSQARWTETGLRADGAKTIGGTLKLPNGWQHDEYDKCRWRVARATLEVLAALGEAPAPSVARTKPPAAEFVTEVDWVRESEAADPPPALTDRSVSIPVLSEAPVIDGDAGEAAWEQARRLEPFTLAAGSGRPKQQTDVLLAADGKTLYLAAVCHEDNVDHLTATVTDDGGQVWQDDCIELFIDHNLDRTTFRQVIVNSLGVQGWNDSTDPKWRAASVAKARVGEDRWTVELAVPMADLGITGPFGLNVCRERRPMETLELSCWSPTGGAFGKPERFGVATLGHAWLGDLRMPPAVLGTNEMQVVLKNETAEPRVVRVELRAEDGKRRTLEAGPLRLGPGSTLERAYPYEVTSAKPATMTLCLLDGEAGEQLLAQRSFSPSVLPPLGMSVRPRMYYLSEAAGTVELEINLAEALREGASVELILLGLKGRRPVCSATVGRLRGNRAVVRMDLSGVPKGSYTLAARLVGGNGKRLAEVTTAVARVAGPFG